MKPSLVLLSLSALLLTAPGCGSKDPVKATRNRILTEDAKAGELLATAIQKQFPEGGRLVVWADADSPSDQELLKSLSQTLSTSGFELISFETEALNLPAAVVRERAQMGEPLPGLAAAIRGLTPEVAAFVCLTGTIPLQTGTNPLPVFAAVLSPDQVTRRPLPSSLRGYVLREGNIYPDSPTPEQRLVIPE